MLKAAHIKNGLLVFGALFIAIMSMRYLSFEKQDLLRSKPDELWNSVWYPTLFFAHVILGIVALLAGPTQFFPNFRRRKLSLHRLLGRVYVIAVAISGIAGLIIAFYALGGWVSQTGFFFLAVFWLFFTFKAYITIKRGQVEAHRRWMNRSYALTFGAVTLRLGLLLSVIGLVDFMTIYPIMAWMCWVLNLAIIEWVMSRQTRRPAPRTA